jgi:hypothetical protein
MKLNKIFGSLRRAIAASKRFFAFAVLLGSGLLLGRHTRPVVSAGNSIEERVLAVRQALHMKVTALDNGNKGLELFKDKLTRSELLVAQWASWNNWGNWGNWGNWANWTQFNQF